MQQQQEFESSGSVSRWQTVVVHVHLEVDAQLVSCSVCNDNLMPWACNLSRHVSSCFAGPEERSPQLLHSRSELHVQRAQPG